MEDEINSSDSNVHKKVGFFGKLFAFIVCIIIGIVAGQYEGVFAGIFVCLASWGWLYFNVLKYRPKTREDVLYEQNLEVERTLLRPYKKKILYFGALLLFSNIIIFAVTKEFGLLVLLDTLCAVSFLYFSSKLKNNSDKIDRETIAQEMGFMFTQKGDTSLLHEKLIRFGTDIEVSNLFAGMVENFSVTIFDFRYRWMKKASYEVTMLEITNIKRCPNMLIVSKDSTFGETLNVENIFPNVTVELEGNFSNYFNLFVESGAEDEIRQFLTPDIMVALIDTMPELNFAFFDDKIYVVLSSNSDHGFLKDDFINQVNKAKFIISKWSLTLSKMEFHR